LVDRQDQFAASVRQRTSDRTGEKAWYHKYRSPDSNSARQHGISILDEGFDATPVVAAGQSYFVPYFFAEFSERFLRIERLALAIRSVNFSHSSASMCWQTTLRFVDG